MKQNHRERTFAKTVVGVTGQPRVKNKQKTKTTNNTLKAKFSSIQKINFQFKQN